MTRDFPAWLLSSGKFYAGFSLLPPNAVIDDKCAVCVTYRRRLWRALCKFRPRLALRFAYFGALRWFELDRRISWVVPDVPQNAAPPLRNKPPLRYRVHVLMLRLSAAHLRSWSRQSLKSRAAASRK